MNLLMILFVIIGLSFLILIHEAGHFTSAKLFGLKVDEFGIGFPPRIFSWRKKKNILDKSGNKKVVEGETEYSVNWLPFGGFVKIAGERGEFSAAEKISDEISGSDESKKESQEVDKSRLFFSQPAWKKSVILLAGIFMNFIIGWFLISLAISIPAPKALVISKIEANSPASSAGFAEGDIVKNFSNSTDFINYVNANRGKQISIDVLRQGKELNIPVTPRVSTAQNEGAVGVYLENAGHPGENFFLALIDGFNATVNIAWMTLVAFGQLIAQLFLHGSLLSGVVGPIGIFGVAQETGKIGLIYFIQFLGVISVNLAVVNLIPFPALDGGRFLITIIEKIKGSPVPEKFEMWFNGAGFAFLIVLMVLLTIRDVTNIF